MAFQHPYSRQRLQTTPKSPRIAADPSAAGGGLINQPDHRADAQAHLSRDATDADAMGPQRQCLLHLLRLALFHRPPAKLFAFSTRTGEASHDALTDHGMLELGEYTEHLEHRAAGWCCGVQALLVQEQIDALGMKLGQKRQQMGERAARAWP